MWLICDVIWCHRWAWLVNVPYVKKENDNPSLPLVSRSVSSSFTWQTFLRVHDSLDNDNINYVHARTHTHYTTHHTHAHYTHITHAHYTHTHTLHTQTLHTRTLHTSHTHTQTLPGDVVPSIPFLKTDISWAYTEILIAYAPLHRVLYSVLPTCWNVGSYC